MAARGHRAYGAQPPHVPPHWPVGAPHRCRAKLCWGGAGLCSSPAMPPAFAGEHKMPVSSWAAQACPAPWPPPVQRAVQAAELPVPLMGSRGPGSKGRLGGLRQAGRLSHSWGRAVFGCDPLGRKGLPLSNAGRGVLLGAGSDGTILPGAGPLRLYIDMGGLCLPQWPVGNCQGPQCPLLLHKMHKTPQQLLWADLETPVASLG